MINEADAPDRTFLPARSAGRASRQPLLLIDRKNGVGGLWATPALPVRADPDPPAR